MRNECVEGLRGWIMIWIILFHYTTRYGQLFSVDIPFSFDNGGEIGVAVFFVISGFFLQKSLVNIKQGGKSVLEFIANKYWRLYPAYAISVVIIFTIINLVGLPIREVSWKDFIVNMLFIYHPGFDYVDGAHWFIADLIKIQVFLSLLFLFGTGKRKAIIYVMTFAAMVVLAVDRNYDNEILHKLCIWASVNSFLNVMCGIIISLASHKKDIACLALIILFQAFSVGSPLLFIICVLLFIALIEKKKYTDFIIKSRIFNNKIIVKIGGLSFYWYLIHQNIGYAVIGKFDNYIIGLFSAIILTILMAYILSLFVAKIPKKLI